MRKKPLKFLLLGLSGHVFDFFSLEVSAAFASVASCCLIDSALYGWRPTVVPWNFFRQNVLRDVASFYGTHTWHWCINSKKIFFISIYFFKFLLWKGT